MCYGADEIYTRASMRSLPRWKEFGVFQRTGVLFTLRAGMFISMPHATHSAESAAKSISSMTTGSRGDFATEAGSGNGRCV
jgi:hypothetical protein